MENEQNFTPNPGSNLLLTYDITEILKSVSKWAKFLSVIGFIVTAFIVLSCVSIFVFQLELQKISGLKVAFVDFKNTSMIGVLPLIIIAFIYFTLSIFLYNFSANINQALLHVQQKSLFPAFRNLNRYFKTIGMLVIMMIIFYAIIASLLLTQFINQFINQ